MQKVTHIIKVPPEPHAWIKIVYFTFSDELDEYFCGLGTDDPFSKENLDERVAINSAEQVECPAQISKGQAVWLTPTGNVWIASKENPIDDPEKIILKEGLESQNRDSVQERVERPRENSKHGSHQLWTINKGYVPGDRYNKLVKLTAKFLAGNCNAELKIIPERPVRWDLIPSYLNNGHFDFCYDPYFRTAARSNSVDVVQFGWTREVTFFVSEHSDIYSEIKDCKREELPLKETLLRLNGGPGIKKIIILGETASATEVITITNRYSEIASKIETCRNAQEMREHLDLDYLNSLVISDIGLVSDLRKVKVSDHRLKKSDRLILKGVEFGYIANDEFTTFPLLKECKVGFIYPLGDKRWEEKIKMALRSAFLELGRKDELNWEGEAGLNIEHSICKNLEKVGVVALSLLDICKNLKIDDFTQIQGTGSRNSKKKTAHNTNQPNTSH